MTWSIRFVFALGLALRASIAVGDGFAGLPVREIQLRELWRRGHEADDLFFGNLDRVTEDAEGRVYVLDTQLCEVRTFAASGADLGRIGRRGEGPGEFDRPADLFAGLDGTIGVLQTFPGRIVTFDGTGRPKAALGTLGRAVEGAPSYRRADANARWFAVSGALSAETGEQEHFLDLHDPEGRHVKRLLSELGRFQYGGMEYREAEFGRFHRRWDLGPSGRVAAAIGFTDYRIRVWNPGGDQAFEIHDGTAQPIVRTRDENAALQRFYDGIVSFNPRSTFEVSDTHPAVVQVSVRDDDTLWVISGRGAFRAPAGVAAAVDVFDAEGGPLHRLVLRGPVDLARDEVYFLGNRVYVVTEASDAAVSATGGSSQDSGSGAIESSQLVCYVLDLPGARSVDRSEDGDGDER